MKKYTIYIIIILIFLFLVGLCFIPIGISKMIPKLEKNISEELGIKVHMEKLVLRGGPYMKLKAPVMYLMYNDGQKLGQFCNIKFYISWVSVLRRRPVVCKLYANNAVINLKSDDKQLAELLKKINQKEFKKSPNFYFKEYQFSYLDKERNDNYQLKGTDLKLDKMSKFENWKLKTDSNFYINGKKFLNISIDLKNNYDIEKNDINLDLYTFIDQIKSLEFYSDVISDLTIYKNKDNQFQASGFINIDNISVLDNYKKCPKSFLYMTLLGNKVSILSNIYTDENKKIYIEGMINNSKKTSVDIKIKSDKVELGDLYKKIKLLSYFTHFKNIDSLSGNLEANFSLKGDLSKIKSNGFFKVSDAKINSNGMIIEKINSDIDLSNNIINIKNATGMVKHAPITAKGIIDKNINIEVQMKNVPLKYIMPQNIGIKDGIITLIANITGNVDNIIHKESVQIENLRIENKENKLYLKRLLIDTNKNNSAYITDISLKIPCFETIKIPSLKPMIEKNIITIPVTNVYMSNSFFKLKGLIADCYNKTFNFNVSIDGRFHSKDIKHFDGIYGTYPLKLTIDGNKEIQNSELKLLIENASVFTEPALISAMLKREKNNVKIEDISISDYNGTLSDVYKINGKNNKKIILSGAVENIENPVFKNLRLFIPQTVNLNINNIVTQIKGDLFINGKYDKPDIVGQLSIQNFYNHLLQMTIVNSVFDFNKNTVIFNMSGVKIGDSSVNLTGTASTENIFKELYIKQLNLKSKYINTDTFLMYNNMIFFNSYPIIVNEAKFYIEKLQTTIYTSPLYLSAVSGDFKIKDYILNIKNLSAEVFNGKIVGQISYDLREDIYSLSTAARQISASPLFSIFINKDDTISGTMDLDAKLNGSLLTKDNIDGILKFKVHNGRMSTLGRLEHLLYAQNVVADSMLRTSLSTVARAVTIKDTGLFKYLRGSIDVKNGRANIHFIQSQGPLMSLLIKGQYNLSDETAKLTILGRLSDEIISGLGSFGNFSFEKLKIMLTGDDNVYNIKTTDVEMLPPLPTKNTKEFYSLINGNIRKSSSVILFNWISYTEKSLRQRDVPTPNATVPSFIDDIQY